MARPIRQKPSFDASKPTLVRRPFRAEGRYWARGVEFPWREKLVTPRRVRQMYDAGHLVHPEEPAERPAPSLMQPQALVEPVVVQAEPETSDGLESLTMPELRAIAQDEGAETARSRDDQIANIRANRASTDQ